MLVLLFAAAGQPEAMAQAARSARSLGMGDSYLTLSSGCEAALLNPANLGLPGRAAYSLKLFSLSAGANSNALTMSDYNRYNGAVLSSSDKETILAKIPDSGLKLDFTAGISALSFSIGSFAFTTQAVGGGYGNLAKDPIVLALMGNKVGELITADGSTVAAWSAVAFGCSYGRRIAHTADYDLTVGATARYLHGLVYFDVTELSARAATLTTGISGAGGLTTREARGGDGYAVDIGVAAAGENTGYGLVVRNLLAAINWNGDVTQTAYSFQMNGLTLENGDDDTAWTSEDRELDSGSFSQRLPLEIELGASRQLGKLLTAASLRQGFRRTAFSTGTPRLAAGAEYRLVASVRPRAGVAVGGQERLSAAVGLGLNYKSFHFDMAYASAGSLVPWSSAGGQIALATVFEFN
jgi:hypothetical protein